MSKGRRQRGIDASSMADIAFLLLLFFLVTTTIDIDAGIPHKLPPADEPIEKPFHKREVLNVFINGNDQLLVEDKHLEITELKAIVVKHIGNMGKLPDFSTKPEKAIISLQNDRNTTYEVYMQVQDEIKKGYNELRSDYLQSHYQMNMSFKELGELSRDPFLSEDERARYKRIREEIKDVYPMKLSEADPIE